MCGLEVGISSFAPAQVLGGWRGEVASQVLLPAVHTVVKEVEEVLRAATELVEHAPIVAGGPASPDRVTSRARLIKLGCAENLANSLGCSADAEAREAIEKLSKRLLVSAQSDAEQL